METIHTEHGTYVEVTEEEKVAIDKKWDYLEAIEQQRIELAQDAGVSDSKVKYYTWWDNENTTVDKETYKPDFYQKMFSTIPWKLT